MSLTSQADTKIAQVNPTLAAGDVKVAVDDAAPANATDIPVVDADFTKRVKVTLTEDEMNGDNISIIFSDASGDEWCDLTVNIQTVTSNQFDDLATAANLATVDTVADAIQAVTDNLPDSGALTTIDGIVDAIVADTNELQTDDVPGLIAALNDPTAAAIRTEMDSNSTQLAAIVADTNELQADWVNGGRLDLLIDAIKAITDALPDSGALTSLATAAALATVDTVVDGILADTGTDGVAIATATAQAIADEILKRGIDNVEDTADALSLAAIVLATLESAVSGTTWTIRKSDGTTFTTKTLTTDSAAEPVTGVT